MKKNNIGGISFIIITNAKKYELTLSVLNRITENVQDKIPYEIIMVGDISNFQENKNIKFLGRPDLASTGQISIMRNLGAENSQYEILFFLDDDVMLEKDWYEKFNSFETNFDIYANKMLLPNGDRCWDKAVLFGGCHTLVDYEHDKYDHNLYQTGTYLVIKRDVFFNIKYNEEIGYYGGKINGENEDVDFSKRLYAAGYHIEFDKNNTVFHMDNTLIQNYNVVVKRNETEFTDSTPNRQYFLTRYEKIYNLYINLFDRKPDDEGFKRYLMDEKLSIEEIENIFKNSEEYKQKNQFNYTYLVDENKPHLGGNFAHNDIASYSESCWKYIIEKFNIKSCLDVGSGRGFSSKFMTNLGVDVTAIDGLKDNVDNALLPTLEFDLTTGPFIKEVDFVNCIEVVEHIDELFINNLMSTLVNGKYVLITHAFPGQEGYHHVNCQLSEYWIDKFNERGYILLTDETETLRNLAHLDNADHIERSGLFFINKNILTQ